MKRLLLLVAGVLWCGDAHAIDFSNGCGSGWNQPVVPDSPMGYEFKKACDEHDNCYSRCEKGGMNYGNKVKCDQTPAVRDARRGTCDEQFDQAIARICESYPTAKICRILGRLYFVAVRLGGSGSFNGREVQALIERLQKFPDYDTSILERRLDTAIQKKEDLSKVRIRIDLATDAASTTTSPRNQATMPDIRSNDTFRENIFDLNREKFQNQRTP